MSRHGKRGYEAAAYGGRQQRQDCCRAAKLNYVWHFSLKILSLASVRCNGCLTHYIGRANLHFDLHAACVSPDRDFFTHLCSEDKPRTVRSCINQQRLTVPNLATDDFLRQWCFNLSLDRPFERPCPIGGV